MLRVENDNSHSENKETKHEISTQAKFMLTSVGIFPESGLQDLPQTYTCVSTIHQIKPL